MAASTAVTWEDMPRNDPPEARAAQIAALTGLRGLAALMVVLIHTSGRSEYTWLGLPGYGPVSLFVLSGYLLYRPWARWSMGLQELPRVGEFFRRRAARIFPAYWVVLVVVSLVLPPARPSGSDGWLRALTLTWIYVPEPLRSALLHTWSLATEVSWYVALPIMGGVTGVVARRFPPATALRVCAALICLAFPISLGWQAWVSGARLEAYLTYPLWLPSFLFCFAGGALVALGVEAHRAGLVDLRRARSFLADPWAALVLALAIALIATSSLGGPPGFMPRTFAENQLRVWCVALVALILLSAVVLGQRSSPLNQLLSTRAFGAIGRWSYGIYLWHVPVVVILERDITFPDGIAGLVWRLTWVLAISIPLGAATYAWVERPVIAWSRRPRRSSADARADADSASASTSSQPSAANPTPSRSSGPAE